MHFHSYTMGHCPVLDQLADLGAASSIPGALIGLIGAITLAAITSPGLAADGRRCPFQLQGDSAHGLAHGKRSRDLFVRSASISVRSAW
jgi:hypothetical protein